MLWYLLWPAIVVIALNIENLSDRLGTSTLLADYVGPLIGYVVEIAQSQWVWMPALAIAGATLALWLDALLRRRETSGAEPLEDAVASGQQPSPLDTFEGEAHERLVRFVSLYLIPACRAQSELQQSMLARLDGNPVLKELAANGLDAEHYWYRKSLAILMELNDSPPKDLTLGQLIDAVGALENDAYREFSAQTGRLSNEVRAGPRDNPVTGRKWEEWRGRHEALVKAYDDIKTSRAYDTRQFGSEHVSLYRPARESRWGRAVQFEYDPS